MSKVMTGSVGRWQQLLAETYGVEAEQLLPLLRDQSRQLPLTDEGITFLALLLIEGFRASLSQDPQEWDLHRGSLIDFAIRKVFDELADVRGNPFLPGWPRTGPETNPAGPLFLVNAMQLRWCRIPPICAKLQE